MNKTVLVNKDNKIKENYLKRINLVETKNVDNEIVLVEEETFKAYNELKEFLLTKNIEIGITSAYRTVEYQQEIYDEFVIKYGKVYADKTVAEPYTSEHHTGLAIDFGVKINDKYLDSNIDIMNNKEKYEEVHKYLKDFGFILRYKEGKENITGYPYEPWHIRYVGKFIAKIIEENNYTLEEYLKDFSGVIVVNKEKGMTSFDVVNEISHLFGIKKVGHTGTLDPLAEGILIVAIGKATKIVELLTAKDKEYIAGIKLGIKTDSYDVEGNVLATKEVPENLNIEEVVKSFKKTYMQEVPIYSAVKVNGKKLYEYARKNLKVELPKKEVTIKKIELLEQTKDTLKIKTLVTKGCYIRSLINDIALSLNNYGIMTSLLRTKQGKVEIKDAYKLEDIRNNNFKIYKIEEVLEYPIIEINEELNFKISNGVKIDNIYNIDDKVIFKYNNKLLGIYEKVDDKLKVWKNFN